MRKVLIAGVTSGSGKTTVVLGLLNALKRHYQIQAYKVGPDYIDTKFHTRITGRPARNLDNFLVPNPATLNYLFTEGTADIDLGIVEGVMGFYDGLGTSKDAYSTASLAKQLSIPVILVIDAHATSTTAAAIIKGLVDFDPDVAIKGVIVNNVMSANHYQLVKGAIDRYVGVPVLGYLPHNKAMALPSRQLGLVPDNEISQVSQKIDLITNEVRAHVDLARLVKLAQPVTTNYPQPFHLAPVDFRLGIAQDKAFNFYYADNLNLLKQVGVQLVPFSPIHDQTLPPVDALYFGGGYPEEFAGQLAANQKMKRAVNQFAQAGKPIYAECGGLMYLGQSLVSHGHSYPMVGIFKGQSEMTTRLKRFGYCLARPTTATLLGKAGVTIVGHEFHHSTFTPLDSDLQPVLTMTKVRDGHVVARWQGGYQIKRTFASYLHVHFYQNEAWFKQFLSNWGAVKR